MISSANVGAGAAGIILGIVIGLMVLPMLGASEQMQLAVMLFGIVGGIAA